MGKYLYFGDSNIGMFSLSKNRNIKIRKYKGASARGLSKSDNPNRIDIINNMNKIQPDCAVFNFGVVDLFFSVYHKLFESEKFELDDKKFVEIIVEGYANFLKDLSNKHKHTQFYVIMPHYHPVRVEDMPGCIYSYNSVSKDLVLANINKLKPYTTRKYRNQLVDMFISNMNNHFRGMSKFHIINIMPEISTDGIIHDKYIISRKVSLYNIHLCWETTILHYLKPLKNCGLSLDTLDLTQFDKYMETQRAIAKKRDNK
jgi:hypothetical protein